MKSRKIKQLIYIVLFLILIFNGSILLITNRKIENNTSKPIYSNNSELRKSDSDDNYEENDWHTSAYNLIPYKNVWLTEINGYGICADMDWYEIYAKAGETLYIECLFLQEDGNIDLYLYYYNVVLDLVSKNFSISDNKCIEYTVTKTGIHKIMLYDIYAFENRNSYDLRWSTTAPLTDDYYEPNNDFSTSYNLTSYENIWLNSINGYGIQADEDWYKINVTADGMLCVKCKFSHAEGDINLELYDSGLNLVGFSDSVSNYESIKYNAITTEVYYILVYHGNTGHYYNLKWSIDDYYELNNNVFSAYNLTSYENIWLNSINGYGIQADEDWYKINVTADRTLYIECTFSHAEGDINLELYDSELNLVDISDSNLDKEYIECKVNRTEFLYILIYHGNAENNYNLKWSIDDYYEQNNDFSTSYNLASYEDTWLSSIYGYGIQADYDWYKINVTADETLYIECTFSHAEGNINLDLYDGNIKLIGKSDSNLDKEYIECKVNRTEFLYILIYHGNARNCYNLRYSTSTENLTPPVEEKEDNDKGDDEESESLIPTAVLVIFVSFALVSIIIFLKKKGLIKIPKFSTRR